jgi:hypothetical protein
MFFSQAGNAQFLRKSIEKRRVLVTRLIITLLVFEWFWYRLVDITFSRGVYS